MVTSSGSVEYTPAAHYCNDATSGAGAGPDDTFDYRLNGGATATVYVTVHCVPAADGSGSLTTPTGFVRNGSVANTLVFTYTVAAGGLSNGALSLEVPEGWSPPSATAGDAGYVVANTGSRSVSGRTVTVSGLTLGEGKTVVVTYGARASGGPGATAPTASVCAELGGEEQGARRRGARPAGFLAAGHRPCP